MPRLLPPARRICLGSSSRVDGGSSSRWWDLWTHSTNGWLSTKLIGLRHDCVLWPPPCKMQVTPSRLLHTILMALPKPYEWFADNIHSTVPVTFKDLLPRLQLAEQNISAFEAQPTAYAASCQRGHGPKAPTGGHGSSIPIGAHSESSEASTSGSRADAVCYGCGVKGHTQRNCPEKQAGKPSLVLTAITAAS